MIALSWPTLPFNPVTAPLNQALTPPEIFAGPFGLIFFVVLVPLVRLAARWRPRAAIIGGALVWHIFTAGPHATGVVLGGLLVGAGWLLLLARMVARGRLSPRAMVAGVWAGLTLLILPLWWHPAWDWYGWVHLRTAPLHFLGLAYFYLRLIAWGVELSQRPTAPVRAADTATWLLYPPIMRLGPVLLRGAFFDRLAAWNPRERIAWRQVGKRAGLFVLGGIALGVIGNNLPTVPAGKADFFARPDLYSSGVLAGLLYGLPVQIYLLLWTYNELAATVGLLVGLPVPNNFDWLPRATSVKDFWRRWHVTVGAWLRDYVYIPLGGNRGWVGLHILAVFLFCGLWHGPSWSYVAWGVSQALALIVQRHWERFATARGWDRRLGNRWWTALCWLVTVQYQLITIIVFVDFQYAGTRFVPELWSRLMQALTG